MRLRLSKSYFGSSLEDVPSFICDRTAYILFIACYICAIVAFVVFVLLGNVRTSRPNIN